MVYITGDTHGETDISKLNGRNFPAQNELSKNDFVIIAGDFGFIWEGGKTQRYWLDWFERKSFTTLFIDGNHENFDLLHSFGEETWNGGTIHRINNSVIHLTRGQVYSINNRKFFTFGGGESTDKAQRKEGVSWWKEEMPSKDEYAEGLRNVEKQSGKVDYIITHTAPGRIIRELEKDHVIYNKENTLSAYLDGIIETADFKRWFFGHYHLDTLIKDTFRAIYRDVIQVD